jgi:hypothetical protein
MVRDTLISQLVFRRVSMSVLMLTAPLDHSGIGPGHGARTTFWAAAQSALGSFGAYLRAPAGPAAPENGREPQQDLVVTHGDDLAQLVDPAPPFLHMMPRDLIVPDGLPFNDVVEVVIHARIDRIRRWFERHPQPLRGFLDDVSAHAVCGWAQNPARPEAPVCLDVVLDDVLVAQGLANHHRPGLAEAGLGSGCHAFDIALDDALTPEQQDRVEVRRSGDGAVLRRSKPVAITIGDENA